MVPHVQQQCQDRSRCCSFKRSDQVLPGHAYAAWCLFVSQVLEINAKPPCVRQRMVLSLLVIASSNCTRYNKVEKIPSGRCSDFGRRRSTRCSRLHHVFQQSKQGQVVFQVLRSNGPGVGGSGVADNTAISPSCVRASIKARSTAAQVRLWVRQVLLCSFGHTLSCHIADL